MDTRHFHKHLFDESRRLFPEGRVIVLAVSGGSDSMALLHGMQRVNELRSLGWELHVAHLDHHIPHNSGEMCEFVRSQCEALSLPCHTDFVDVPALSEDTGESIEEAGRKARYSFLIDVCQDVNADCLATAHQAEDQAETVLHRILRGTGLHGMRGIPDCRWLDGDEKTKLVRPLLTLRRRDCVEYLNRRGLSFMHDATNDDISAATRNYVRHRLIPEIESEINPRVVDALTRLSQQSGDMWDLLNELVHAASREVTVEESENVIRIDVELLSNQRAWLRGEIFRRAIERSVASMKDVDANAIDRALALLDNTHPRTVEIAGGVSVDRAGRFISIKSSNRQSQVSKSQDNIKL